MKYEKVERPDMTKWPLAKKAYFVALTGDEQDAFIEGDYDRMNTDQSQSWDWHQALTAAEQQTYSFGFVSDESWETMTFEEIEREVNGEE